MISINVNELLQRLGLTQNRSGADIKQESSAVGAYPDRRDNDIISACYKVPGSHVGHPPLLSQQDRRRVLATVVKSQLLYAAPMWADATAVSSYMRGVNSTYHLCAVRIASALTTISDDAALVIAGQVPLCEPMREAK